MDDHGNFVQGLPAAFMCPNSVHRYLVGCTVITIIVLTHNLH